MKTYITPATEAAFPFRTAGQLPAIRTEDIYTRAVATEDMSARANIMHIWGHYQSLELILNAVDNDPQPIINMMAGELDLGAMLPKEVIAATLRVVATEVLQKAYKNAHDAGEYAVRTSISIPDGLRAGYNQLDFGDPSVEADLEAFLKSVLPE